MPSKSGASAERRLSIRLKRSPNLKDYEVSPVKKTHLAKSPKRANSEGSYAEYEVSPTRNENNHRLVTTLRLSRSPSKDKTSLPASQGVKETAAFSPRKTRRSFDKSNETSQSFSGQMTSPTKLKLMRSPSKLPSKLGDNTVEDIKENILVKPAPLVSPLKRLSMKVHRNAETNGYEIVDTDTDNNTDIEGKNCDNADDSEKNPQVSPATQKRLSVRMRKPSSGTKDRLAKHRKHKTISGQSSITRFFKMNKATEENKQTTSNKEPSKNETADIPAENVSAAVKDRKVSSVATVSSKSPGKVEETNDQESRHLRWTRKHNLIRNNKQRAAAVEKEKDEEKDSEKTKSKTEKNETKTISTESESQENDRITRRSTRAHSDAVENTLNQKNKDLVNGSSKVPKSSKESKQKVDKEMDKSANEDVEQKGLNQQEEAKNEKENTNSMKKDDIAQRQGRSKQFTSKEIFALLKSPEPQAEIQAEDAKAAREEHGTRRGRRGSVQNTALPKAEKEMKGSDITNSVEAASRRTRRSSQPHDLPKLPAESKTEKDSEKTDGRKEDEIIVRRSRRKVAEEQHLEPSEFSQNGLFNKSEPVDNKQESTKKRGRPSKSLDILKDEQVEELDATGEQIKPVRPRGRPRKSLETLDKHNSLVDLKAKSIKQENLQNQCEQISPRARRRTEDADEENAEAVKIVISNATQVIVKSSTDHRKQSSENPSATDDLDINEHEPTSPDGRRSSRARKLTSKMEGFKQILEKKAKSSPKKDCSETKNLDINSPKKEDGNEDAEQLERRLSGRSRKPPAAMEGFIMGTGRKWRSSGPGGAASAEQECGVNEVLFLCNC